MIQSRPKLRGKKLIIKSFSFIFLCVVLYMFSSAFHNFAFIAQIIAILSATYSLFILIKYVIPDYLYTIENGRLTVHKVTKSQSVCIADIDVADAVQKPICYNEYKSSDYRKKSTKLYKFVKNPDSDDIRYIVFSDGYSMYTVEIEPDNNFIEILCREIENSKNTHDSEEENEEF